MTEASDTLEKKTSTVGRLLPHTFAKIVARDDPSSTRVLKAGEKGELLIGGYSVMKKYWNDDVRTSEARVTESLQESHTEGDGEIVWMRTGDEALVDADRYVTITGRIKDIIIRGGENVYPSEIENVLLQHPQILDASVVGLPDVRYGEVVAAFIRVRASMAVAEGDVDEGAHRSDAGLQKTSDMTASDDVRTWVQDRLSKMLVPKHVFYVASMPLTATGKVEKYKLRAMGLDLLDRQSRQGD